MDEMLGQIRSLGDQLRWAAELDSPPIGTYSEILFAGMGGSGIAGDYATALTASTGTRVAVHRGYGPVPPWTLRVRPLVIATSYSGNTEETLDFVVSARDSGLPVAVVTSGGRLGQLATDHHWPSMTVPGGLQPRAALGYMLGAVVRILESAHALDDQRLAFVEAVSVVDQEVEEGSASWDTASGLADELTRRIPIIYAGGELSGAVARRWKTQINENAKSPAWWSLLPELDHNEITGWETLGELTRKHLGVVAVTDRSDHDRIATRLSHTMALIREAVPWAGEVASRGSYGLTRLLSLTVVGDLLSWMLARRSGVDPTPVETIEKLKRLLAEDER